MTETGKQMPAAVIEAWEKKEGPVIFSTVDRDGKPNAIYATCVGLYGKDRIVIADNYFHKTRENIQAGSPGSVLFITADNKAYQVKGAIEYHTEGAIFDDMKTWNPEKHPGHAAAAVVVEEIYSGAERLM